MEAVGMRKGWGGGGGNWYWVQLEILSQLKKLTEA